MSNNIGVSKGTFVAGIVIAILLSSIISLSLSMQFAVGPQGETGPQGTQGIQGIQGVQGILGETGSQGVAGDTGSQGPKGDTGEQGLQGTQGIAGTQGEQGIQGYKGDIGSIGPIGGFGEPDYDSGWGPLYMDQWTFFDHNLGQNDNILVYIIGRYYSVDNTWIVNQEQFSITWTTTDENSIRVYRLADDYYYDEARVLIWKIEDTNQLY